MRISDWSSDVCSSDLAKTLLFENDKAYQVRAVSPDRRSVGLSRIVDNATKHCYVYDRTDAKLLQLTVEGQPVAGETPTFADTGRTAARRVGKGCVRTCRYRWSPDH